MKKARKSRVGLIVALVAALSCSSMVAVSQLCYKNCNGVITASADTTSGVATHVDAAEISALWASKVQESVGNSGAQVTFELPDNWTAEDNDEYTTAFGVDADDATVSAFHNGRIYIPAGANIVLDLKGYTIDRGLTGEGVEAVENGGVIFIEGGTLEIKDTSTDGTGVITGGNSTLSGGGVYVYDNSSFTMSGGTISGNIAGTNAGGVYVYESAFTMKDGTITGNTAKSSGGGTFVSGTLEMTGGEISGNNATNNGGGVYVYENSTFSMEDGEISGNNATGNGGGVYVTDSGSFTLDGGEIKNNTAVGRGGGVYVYDNGSFTLESGKINDNEATSSDSYGGGLHSQNATIIINDGEISGNKSALQGGGIAISGGALTIAGGKISDNKALGTLGGGILSFGGNKITMTAGEISGNTATTNGGGIALTGSTGSGIPVVEMSGGKISGNTADSVGGGVYVASGSSFTLTAGGEISGNTGTQGGGFYVNGNSTIIMGGGAISGNTATTGSGGGLFIYPGTFILSGGEISGNKALGGQGGAIYGYGTSVSIRFFFTMSGGTIGDDNEATTGGGVYSGSNSTFTMSGGTISGNKSTTYGGGVRINNNTAEFIMTGGEISGNEATTYAGGVYVNSGTFTMTAGKINGNEATTYAGGVYVNSGTFTMSGGEIKSNEATTNGGGVYVTSSTFTLNDGEISENTITSTSTVYGGGVYQSTGTFTMNGGTISKNTVTSTGSTYGGGIYKTGTNSSLIINNGTISGNEAQYGGGVDANHGTFTMNGGTISGNTATTAYGGGVYNRNSCVFTMNGGTITGNTATTNGGGVYYNSGSFNLNGGAITDNTAGATYNGGGVYVNSSAFNVTSGVVFGNELSDGSANNVYIPSASNYVKVAGKLSSNTYIGIANAAARTVTSGYATYGNKLSKANSFFVSDSASYAVSDDGSSEVTLIASSSSTTKTDFDWSFTSFDSKFNEITHVDADGKFSASVTYTGGAFVFDASNIGVVDDNGKTVGAIVNAGTYYLTVPNADKAKYNNPVFTLSITPAGVSELNLSVEADSVVYTGSALTTSVRVYSGTALLEENKDYILTYSNNINAGAGLITVTAIGNYSGNYESTFTIEKAKLSIRWGVDKVEYTGSSLNIAAYTEGVLTNVTINPTLNYVNLATGSTVHSGVGEYIVTAVLDHINYELDRTYEHHFTIVPKKVDVVWGEASFTYGGDAKTVTAYYINGTEQVELTVTYLDKSGNPVDEAINAGTYTAVAAEPSNTNFALTLGTKQITFTIVKAEVEATWPNEMPVFEYDGTAKEISGLTLTGLSDEDLSADLTYTYYDADGNEIADPVNAGTYKVVITLTNDNYVLSGKTEDTFTIEKQTLVLTLDDGFNGEYDGVEKSPFTGVTVNGNVYAGENYTVTYALVDDAGIVLENLGETKPTDAGKYVLTVTVKDEVAANIENPVCTEAFEITAKEAEIEWVFDDLAVKIDDVYTYLYDGTTHQPKAYLVDDSGNRIQANGKDIELTVTGTGKSVGKGYKSVAASSNSNYVLSGDTEVSFNVIKSKVLSILWYEYGSTEPIVDGVKPSYEYIFVYGQEEGAKLSAYGVLTAADDNITWESTKCQVKLVVTYSTYYEGYWAIGTYTAQASLSSADGLKDSCYMPLGINDTLEFDVTAITHSANVANILWVVVSEDAEGNVKHTVVNANTKFEYNGELQSPKAILVLGNTYDPDYPEEGTYQFLKVAGEATEAGTYYAYIIPDPTATYEIKAEDSECKFVISPVEISIKWEEISEEGVIEVTYNGQEQAPKAYLVDEDGEAILDESENKIYLTVEGYTDAGTYQVTATADANHKVKNGDPVKFVIKQFEIKTSDIVWSFADNDKGTEKGGDEGTEKYFEWKYDGKVHTPVASLKVTLIETEDGEDPVEVTVKLSLTGSATTAGTHYAYATLDSTDYANANFKMEVAKLRLEIVQNAVTVIWDDADESGTIVFPYDGKAHTPKAHYMNGEERVELTVIGEGTDAGKYVALITDDIGSSDVRKTFTIEAKQIKAKWNEETLKYDYNGTLRTPSVSFVETELDEEGNEVSVALVLGKDYTVSGFVNAGNYTSEITMLNGNYKVTSDTATKPFVVSKRAVTLTWYGVGGYDEETGGDTKNFVWAFNNEKHAPTVRANVDGLDITVIGAESSVGNYTAIAILNSENYVISTLSSAECNFSIVGSSIHIIWVGEDDSTEDFEWEYDGEDHAPKAYWAEKGENGELQFVLDEDGNKIELQVIGVGIYSGDYTAKAILPDSNCDWADGISGKCEFTITKQIVSGIVWVGNKVDNGDGTTSETFTWEYDGEYHVPTVTDDKAIIVLGKEINKGTYTATAILANSENYAFAEDVNPTKEFTIAAKKVLVTWQGDEKSTLGENNIITWEYDKAIHCPTASFVDVKGNTVQIPVIGGTASGGQHVATLMEVFENYEFSKAALTRTFVITQMSVTVAWGDDEDHKTVGEDNAITYTYTYNGSTQMPQVTAKHGEDDVALSYLIKLNGKAVNAIISAGTYEVTVSPANNNYNITSGEKTVTVIVEALEVEVEWVNVDDGKVVLTYNGTAQAPEAYFEYTVKDAEGNNQTVRVTLSVDGAQTEVNKEGESYTATATIKSANFILKEGTAEIQFEIVPSSADEYEWDWTSNDWKAVDNSSSEEGEGGEDKPVPPPANTDEDDEDEKELYRAPDTEEGEDKSDSTVSGTTPTTPGTEEGDGTTTPDATEPPANGSQSGSGEEEKDPDEDGDDKE